MAGTGTACGGLRERKKRATRHALSDAALRLALDRGLEHLTVEEISEAAGVSARTFFNYFSSKEEALLGDNPLLTGEVPAQKLVTEAGSVLEGLRQVLTATAAERAARREEFRLRRELLERHPELVPRLSAKFAASGKVLASAVAARTGADPADAYPQLMAAVAFAMMQTATGRWTAGHGDRPLEDHIGEMFRLLKAELSGDGKDPREPGQHETSLNTTACLRE